MTTSLSYDDNRNLTVENEESAWSARLSPRLTFRVAEENKGLSGSAGVSFRKFFREDDNQSNNDSNDVTMNFGVNSFLNTELSNYNMLLAVDRSKTSETQLVNGDTVDADTISENATRITTSAGGGWSRRLTERASMSLSYRHSTLRYTDTLPNSSLVETDADSVSAGLSRGLSPSLSGNLFVSYNSFRPNTNLDSETVSVTGGLSGRFSETMSGAFSIGRRKTNFDTRGQVFTGFCVGANPGSNFPECTGGFPVATGTKSVTSDDNNTGLTFNASFNKQFEKSFIGVSASRAVVPNTTAGTDDGSSGVLNTTTFNLLGRHNLSQRLNTGASLLVVDREDITSGNGSDNRKFLSFSTDIRWRWHPDLQLSATYTHRENEEAGSSETASGNSITFSVNYTGRLFTSSR